MKEIAVVICNYNGIKYVLECVERILASEGVEFDVFLVDNASTDDSVSALEKRFGDRITIIKNKENLGGAGGFQTGFLHALNKNYKYIMALDNDAFVAKDTLRLLYEYLIGHPEVGMAASKIMCMEEPDKVIDYAGKLDFPSLKVDMRWWMKPDCEEAEKVADTDFAPTTASLIRREALEASGGMDPEYFIYVDDIEMSWRIRLSGFKVVSVGYARAWHKTGNSRELAPSTFGHYYFNRNRCYFFSRYAKEDEVESVAESILKETWQIMRDAYYNGYPAAFTTQKYVLEDFIDGIRGKAGAGRVLKREYYPENVTRVPDEDEVGYNFFKQLYYDRLMERISLLREEMKEQDIPKVSVIIPIDASSEYLQQCLESVLNQSLTKLQIICVEHGTDNAGKSLLDDYSTRDSRIKVIHSEAQEYGKLINLGIDNAEGDYLCIIKSSDYIEKDMLKTLYEAMLQTHADVVKSDCTVVREGSGSVRREYVSLTDSNKEHFYRKILTQQDMLGLLYKEKYTWFCMYRRSFLNENSIRCYENAQSVYHNKSLWIQTVTRAHRIYFLDESLYNCRLVDYESAILDEEALESAIEDYRFAESRLDEIENVDSSYYEWLSFCLITDGLRLVHLCEAQNKESAAVLLLEEIIRHSRQGKINEDLFDKSFMEEVNYLMWNIDAVVKKDSEHVDAFLAKIIGFPNYIIYGAGKWGQKLLAELQKDKLGQRIEYFAVSDEKGNPYEIEGIPVKVISEGGADNKTLAIIAVKEDQGIEEKLKAAGIENIISYRDLRG